MKTDHHEARGYAYIITGPVGKPTKSITVYRGLNAVREFLNALIREEEDLSNILTIIVPLQMSLKDEDFCSATMCYLCKEVLNESKIHDHDHLYGRYRRALHNNCKSKISSPEKCPPYFLI